VRLCFERLNAKAPRRKELSLSYPKEHLIKSLIPAKAGIQALIKHRPSGRFWIPAFAGMTEFDVSVRLSATCEYIAPLR
jgi:hypothetical protein